MGKGLGRSREQEGIDKRGEGESEKEVDGGRERGGGCLMLTVER